LLCFGLQAACLAKCNGANVSLHRYGSFGLQGFRQAVAAVCASGEEHLVVSYSRKAFNQTGDGHFSPVGGYHAARDLVLILDTVSRLSPVAIMSFQAQPYNFVDQDMVHIPVFGRVVG
jgi:hypothetical protein